MIIHLQRQTGLAPRPVPLNNLEMSWLVFQGGTSVLVLLVFNVLFVALSVIDILFVMLKITLIQIIENR